MDSLLVLSLATCDHAPGANPRSSTLCILDLLKIWNLSSISVSLKAARDRKLFILASLVYGSDHCLSSHLDLELELNRTCNLMRSGRRGEFGRPWDAIDMGNIGLPGKLFSMNPYLPMNCTETDFSLMVNYFSCRCGQLSTDTKERIYMYVSICVYLYSLNICVYTYTGTLINTQSLRILVSSYLRTSSMLPIMLGGQFHLASVRYGTNNTSCGPGSQDYLLTSVPPLFINPQYLSTTINTSARGKIGHMDMT